MQDDPIVRDPVRFTSGDGSTEIHAFLWHDPENAAPKGIVQIAHGMAEHIARYDDFARFLVTRGYVVAGHDQLAHGASATPETWGVLPAKNGKDILLQDIGTLNDAVVGTIGRGTPVFLFGHSLGSYLVRAYLTRRGGSLAGAVLSGTGHVSPAVSHAGHLLACALCAKSGDGTKSQLLHDMGVGAYAKQIKDAKTDCDWLSYNEENVAAYRADERCGFMFSAGGYAMLTSLTGEVCSPNSAKRIPKALPLLFVSGADDPVGDCGKGVTKACEMARAAGVADVELKLYQHMRHEILNETGHEAVYEDIARWLDAHAE